MRMKRNVKIALCILLMAFACASLAVVLGSLGVLPAGAMGPGYLLKDVDGRIGVYCPADTETPTMLTDVLVRDLPLGDRVALTNGIRVSDYGAVTRLLEDYGA